LSSCLGGENILLEKSFANIVGYVLIGTVNGAKINTNVANVEVVDPLLEES
jgi:hypothetical protein